jgi:LacI family transcriptional regulator
MVTIHDVAKLAGVSIATVSHVLNNTKNVSPETEEKVKKAISNINYIPNTAAKSLKSQDYKSIGVIAEDISAFSTPPIIDAVCGYLNERGYTITLCNLRTYSHSQYDTQLLSSSMKILEASRARGAIYIGAASPNVSFIRSMIKVPVLFAYSSALETDYSIDYDNYKAARLAATYLVSNGHKRIAIIAGSLDQDFVHQRIMGFQSVIIESSLLLSPDYILSGDWNYDLAYQQTCKLLELPEPPTAIFAMNDSMACAVIAASRKYGLTIPEDLSVIGFDNRSCSAFSTPAITTLGIPLYEIGITAASSFLKLLDGETIPYKQLLDCTLIERESVSSPTIKNL